MPSIPFQLVNLTSVKPSARLEVPLPVLLKAAAVVGTPPPFAGIKHRRPLLEILWRVSTVWSNLEASDGHWVRSKSYRRLDPSEKTSVSYFLGMVQAQLSCTKLLGYTHLSHLDALLTHAKKPLAKTRPDFLAVNARKNAFVATVEAKGRTHGFSQAVVDDAKAQAQTIPTLSGFTSQASIASLAYFRKDGAWSAHLADPPPQGDALPLGLEDVLFVYYRNIIDAGRATNTWAITGEIAQFSLPEMPVQMSLPTALVSAYDKTSTLDKAERSERTPLLNAYREVSSAVPEAAEDLVDLVITDEAAEYDLEP